MILADRSEVIRETTKEVKKFLAGSTSGMQVPLLMKNPCDNFSTGASAPEEPQSIAK
jgi:hypothetical protein